MLAFFLSLVTTIMAPVTATPAPNGAQFAWLGGTWRTEALEMKCAATRDGMACREVGRGETMKGASVDLKLKQARADAGSQLTVALPNIPPSVFTEIGRTRQSVTFQTTTKMGLSRLRFTRTGDELKIERGNAERFATTMTYRKG